MIYEIYIDNRILFYPDDERYVVINAELNQALNDSGTLEFDIPAENPEFENISSRSSMIQVKKNGEEIFYGEVREIKVNIDMTKHVYAVGELAFLFDTIQPQKKYQNKRPEEVFDAILANHNSQADNKKKFTRGAVTVEDKNNSIYRFTNYEDTLTAIREKLCDTLNGFLRIRKENGTRYLDLVKITDYGTPCNQPIIFGRNLLDYDCSYNAQDIATSVIPLGAMQEESEVEGLDSYLTIKSVNNNKDYINASDEAIEGLGMIRVVKHWDDVTVAANLKKKAQDWLENAQFETMTINLNAVDLSSMDADFDSFMLGDTVEIRAPKFGIQSLTLPVQKKTIYINELSRNYITLGNTLQLSYTAQASKAASTIEDSIPQENAMLQIAKNNAWQIIDGTQGGCIYFVKSDSGQIEEIRITNSNTPGSETKRWVWKIGGWMFQEKKADGTWDDPKIAATMSGELVADRITSGTLRAINIDGVTITGATINTLTDGLIKSERSDGSLVQISGGALRIVNTADSFLELQRHGYEGTDSHRITFGADTWTYWGDNNSIIMDQSAIERFFSTYGR